MKSLGITFFMLCISLAAFGTTTLSGQEPAYKGVELRLYAYSDLVSKTPQLLGTTKVKENGDFAFSVDLKESQILHIPYLSFRMMFYAEPNQAYELKLPPFEKLTADFRKRPIYQSIQISLGSKDKNDLNQKINKFDYAFDQLLRSNFDRLYNKGNTDWLQNDLKNLTNNTSDTPAYFKQYKQYKGYYLEYVANSKHPQKLRPFFEHKKIHYGNTAYMNLLKKCQEQLFFEVFNAPTKAEQKKTLERVKSYTQLTSAMQSITQSTDQTLNELICLIALYDAYYQNVISFQFAKQLLALIQQNSRTALHREISKNILQKWLHLKPGTSAPDFTLYDGSKRPHQIVKMTKGKPTLLAFYDKDTPLTTTELNNIKEIYTNYASQFSFVPILVGEGEVSTKEYPWTFLYTDYQSSIITDYQIRSFPHYLLLDEKGRIADTDWRTYFDKVIKNSDR